MRACELAHLRMHVFVFLTPLIYTLKNSEKYFQNKKNIFRFLDPLLKKTFFVVEQFAAYYEARFSFFKITTPPNLV